MQDDALEQVVAIIKAEPHGGLSLTLYALVSPLKENEPQSKKLVS